MDGTGVGLADGGECYLHGRKTRVRSIQIMVKNSVGSVKPAANVDRVFQRFAVPESSVWDQAFQGPGCVRLDSLPMSYYREQGPGRSPRTIKTITLPIRSATGLRKTLTLKHQQDSDAVGFNEYVWV
ncbi:hypothetical protein RSOLAG22IIIB_10188 [Rhizoctonia solani]|uniref:Uncharacterized protein n=1 Tax=Rhizoctonia solani TaxID=456999 RepID=A0A0K6G2K4_9AGAM|nr:hypothetical protein RSOLAG22IIIB_10188 [Rhizoctonia solani]